ncbi:hypothetical protein ZWY2020_016865 [Hordeum vulgare]|nr:hypothetical protein ZWY2020_016865 [Hordeum vulgare]
MIPSTMDAGVGQPRLGFEASHGRTHTTCDPPLVWGSCCFWSFSWTGNERHPDLQPSGNCVPAGGDAASPLILPSQSTNDQRWTWINKDVTLSKSHSPL